MKEEASFRRIGLEKELLDPDMLTARGQMRGQDGPPAPIAGGVDDAFNQSTDFLHGSEDRQEV
jgi:hypothetical protein